MDNCPKKDCHEPNALIFRKIVIPASVADDRVNPPKNGEYCNQLVYYEASGNAYLFSSDGLPTLMTADVAEIVAGLKKETAERKEEDLKIWDEIETIEAASDVVDVVGTYAELQAYDTSKLQDNDLIKVLADETHNGAITYYRWSTSTEAFTYIGSEGPYYTEGQVDSLLSAKQDTLIAGTNIQIAADGKTISATDTTYSAFSGATSGAAGTSGLVPAPLAGDQNKVLKGDGTWSEPSVSTIFYADAGETGGTRHIYKASNMTGTATMQDIIDANAKGQVILRISTSVDPSTYSDAYLQNAYVASGDYQMIFLDNQYYYGYDTTATSMTTFDYSRRELQTKLTAGSNVQINGNTISATDTTYSAFTGTDGMVAGTSGLVPAPATTDDGKFLKADGTWATVQSGAGSKLVAFDVDPNDSTHILFYSDTHCTQQITNPFDDVYAAAQYGEDILLYDCINGGPGGEEFTYKTTAEWPDSDAKMYVYGLGVENGVLSPNLYKVVQFDFQSGDSYATIDYNVAEYQPKLTAGTNIAIDQSTDTISMSASIPVLYGSQGQNTDGAVTQKVFTDTVGDVESILQILNSGAGV